MCSVVDGATYDRNINLSDGYEMSGSMKRVYACGGLPYCKLLDQGALVRFSTLHFQGTAKPWLGKVPDDILRSAVS